MSLQLRATRQQLADLKKIAELGVDNLVQVFEKLQGLPNPTIGPQELLAVVSALLPDDAECLVRQLLSLQGLMRQTGRSVDEVMSGLRTAIEREGADVGLSPTEWDRVVDILKQLVEEQSVRLSATAIELAYDYANLLRRTKILTDIRPLFSENAETIEGAVVSYTLRLHYNSADGEHELSVALDQADVQALVAQCLRALKKADTSRSLMIDKCGIGVTVSGEANDGN